MGFFRGGPLELLGDVGDFFFCLGGGGEGFQRESFGALWIILFFFFWGGGVV